MNIRLHQAHSLTERRVLPLAWWKSEETELLRNQLFPRRRAQATSRAPRSRQKPLRPEGRRGAGRQRLLRREHATHRANQRRGKVNSTGNTDSESGEMDASRPSCEAFDFLKRAREPRDGILGRR